MILQNSQKNQLIHKYLVHLSPEYFSQNCILKRYFSKKQSFIAKPQKNLLNLQNHLITNQIFPHLLVSDSLMNVRIFSQFTIYLFSLQRRMLDLGFKRRIVLHIRTDIYRASYILQYMSGKVSFCSKEHYQRVYFENLSLLCQCKMGKKEPKPDKLFML